MARRVIKKSETEFELVDEVGETMTVAHLRHQLQQFKDQKQSTVEYFNQKIDEIRATIRAVKAAGIEITED